MDDGDSFFGFDAAIPNVSRGPRQELGDVELEEYDNFNDETFGADALADDWEEQHERLAECLVEDDGKSEADENIDMAVSVSQLILDDDDLDSSFMKSLKQPTKSTPIAARLFGKSSPPPYLLEADIVGSPSTQSIWSAFATNRKIEERTASPLKSAPLERSNGTSVQPGILPPELKTFKTVEDLERELLKPKPSTPMTVADLERSIRASGGKIRSVEEIEAEITRSAQAKSNPPLIPPPMPPVPPHLMGVGPPGALPGLPPGMIPPLGMPGTQLPPHLLRMPGPPLGMPFMQDGLQRMAMPPLPPTAFLPPHRPPGLVHHANGAQRQNTYQKDSYSGDEDYDEYSGLMSMREKQWLLSIQMHQLVSDNPYVDDYYYTIQRLRKSGALKSGPAGQKLILPERAKTDAKPYSPTQFANSLGKLQVVTFTAPRRIIDVDKAPSTEVHPEGSQIRDTRKFKKILLDIENMLYWVMQLEDAGKRFEDSTGETIPVNSDYRHKLESSLNSAERIFQVMAVRKGKVLVMRALRLLSGRFSQLVISTVLCNWQLLFRRDAQDHILFGVLSPLSDYIRKVDNLASLVAMTSPLLLDKKGSFNEILTHQMGLAIISMLLNKSEELHPSSSDAAAQQQWTLVASSIGSTLQQIPESLKPYLETPLFTLKAFQQIGMDADSLKRLERVLERLSEGSSK